MVTVGTSKSWSTWVAPSRRWRPAGRRPGRPGGPGHLLGEGAQSAGDVLRRARMVHDPHQVIVLGVADLVALLPAAAGHAVLSCCQSCSPHRSTAREARASARSCSSAALSVAVSRVGANAVAGAGAPARSDRLPLPGVTALPLPGEDLQELGTPGHQVWGAPRAGGPGPFRRGHVPKACATGTSRRRRGQGRNRDPAGRTVRPGHRGVDGGRDHTALRTAVEPALPAARAVTAGASSAPSSHRTSPHCRRCGRAKPISGPTRSWTGPPSGIRPSRRRASRSARTDRPANPATRPGSLRVAAARAEAEQHSVAGGQATAQAQRALVAAFAHPGQADDELDLVQRLLSPLDLRATGLSTRIRTPRPGCRPGTAPRRPSIRGSPRPRARPPRRGLRSG